MSRTEDIICNFLKEKGKHTRLEIANEFYLANVTVRKSLIALRKENKIKQIKFGHNLYYYEAI